MVSPDPSSNDWLMRTQRLGGHGLPAPDPYRELVEGLPVAVLIVDGAGLVTGANAAASDLLQLAKERIVGEPVLSWIGRASEREGFGRAFRSLRDRDRTSGFALELSVVAELGTSTPCLVRSSRLGDGHVVLTLHPTGGVGAGVENELGAAMTRSLDALDQGVLLLGDGAVIVRANPAALKLLGPGIVGRSFLELANPDSLDGLSRALTVARAGSWQGEADLRRLDGEPVPMELSMAAAAAQGSPAVVLLRDLRERRRREFEDRLVGQIDRRLVASSEPHDNVMGACAALGSGLQAERVVLVVRVRGGWERWGLEGDRPAPIDRLPPGVEPPAPWSDHRDVQPTALAEPEIRRLFGQFGPARSGVRVALRSPFGVVGHLLLVREGELDARDRALMGLLASQIALGVANGLLTLETRSLAAYQAMVLDQSSVMLNSVDAEGRIVTWNRASEVLVGVSVIDALGRRFGVDVARTPDPELWSRLWEALLEEGVVTTQLTVLADDGREIPLHLEGRLLSDGGEVRGAVLVGLDLRERRELERQVLTSQKLAAVGLLAAGIAHELNNPLTGVVGYSALLLESPRLPSDMREKLEKIARSADRCRKIVEGVLLFSRQKGGGVRRRVDLAELTERVLGIGEYQWRMHNVRIHRDQLEPVEVLADGDQLEQVLLNLLSNAVDAMPRGGAIHLSLRRLEDGGASLAVRDEGHGIPEEIQARIFDPFFSTKEIGKGTGLGLAISYGIVRDHGGDILLESAPGRGSTFTVTLPPDGTPPPSTPEPNPPPDPSPSSSRESP